jgi:hypothetical protein
MKALKKLFFRSDRVQPVCTDIYLGGKYEHCEFLVREGNLLGCKAGGVKGSWSIKESQGLYLTTFKELTRRRNYKVNNCPYRFLRHCRNIVSPLVKLIKWIIETFVNLVKK